MKKLSIIILVSLLLFFSGCASKDESPHEEDPSPVSSYVYFNGSTFSFNITQDEDIYDSILVFNKGFIYVHTILTENTLSETELNSLNRVLTHIDSLNDIGYQNRLIMGLSYIEFKELLENNQIIPTTEDIFTFSLLKDIVEEYKNESILVFKTTYLEYLLDKELTNLEINGLELLQSTYSLIKRYDDQFNLETSTLEEYITQLEEVQEVTEHDKDSIEIGFNLIQEALLLIE